MAEKILNTRIQLKYDLYENWFNNNPTLKKGEIAIVEVPAETGAVVQEPAILIKSGNGTDDFKTLPFLSGKAADVYNWAKAENKPTYEAKEITGISDYIAEYVETEMGISVDTDTQYQIVKVDDYNYKLQSKGKGDSAWADVADSAIVIPNDTAAIEALQGLVGNTAVSAQITAAIEALNLSETYDAKGAAAQALVDAKAYADGKDEAIAAAKKAGDDAQAAADAAQGDVDALAGKVGEVPVDKTVVQMIADAQTAATYDDTQVKADIKANTDAIAKLNDASDVEGSVDYKIAQAVAAIMENPDETMNSINELVTWINGHAEDALELSNKVQANEQDIAALEGLVGETAVATQITDAIAAALKVEGVDKYALAADLTAAIGRIAAMEAKVTKWDAAEQNAKDYADGLNTTMDGRVQTAEGKITALEEKVGEEPVADQISAAIEALKIDDYAKAADLTAAIEQHNTDKTALETEIAKKANDADLAAIAKTGNVNDLVQTAGDILVFDCGTSNTVM